MKRNIGRKLLLLLLVLFIIPFNFTNAEQLESQDTFKQLENKKLKFDAFYENFLDNFLSEGNFYTQESIKYAKSESLSFNRDDFWGEKYSEEAWEKLPERNYEFQDFYDQAIMTNLVSKNELDNIQHSLLSMNRADKYEIFMDVVNRTIQKNFFVKAKNFYEMNNDMSNSIEEISNLALNTGIITREDLSKIKDSTPASEEDSKRIILQEVENLIKDRTPVLPNRYYPRAQWVHSYRSRDNVFFATRDRKRDRMMNCYGFASELNVFENPGYINNRNIRARSDLGGRLVSIDEIRDYAIEDMRASGYYSVRIASDQYDRRSRETLIAVRKGAMDYVGGDYPIEDYHFVTVEDAFAPRYDRTHKPGETPVLRLRFNPGRDRLGWPQEYYDGCYQDYRETWHRCINYDYDESIRFIAYQKRR